MTGHKRKTIEFTINSEGHCFLCLNQVLPEFAARPQLRTEPLVCSSKLYPLQNLSQFLKLDFNKLRRKHLHQKQKTKTFRGTVQLCLNCISPLEQFSKLSRQLEKVRMEMISCLEIIHEKLVKAGENGKMRKFLAISEERKFDAGSRRRRELVRALRSETKRKCSRKIKATPPRVRVKELTGKLKRRPSPKSRIIPPRPRQIKRKKITQPTVNEDKKSLAQTFLKLYHKSVGTRRDSDSSTDEYDDYTYEMKVLATTSPDQQKQIDLKRKKEGGSASDQRKSPLGIMEVYQQVLQKSLQKKQIRKPQRRNPDSEEDIDPDSPNEYEMDDFATPDEPIKSEPDFTSEEEELTPDSSDSESHSVGSTSTRSWSSTSREDANDKKKIKRKKPKSAKNINEDSLKLSKTLSPNPDVNNAGETKVERDPSSPITKTEEIEEKPLVDPILPTKTEIDNS